MLATIGAICSMVMVSTSTGVGKAWDKGEEVGEASRLFDRISNDVRGANQVLASDSTSVHLIVGSIPASEVRYVVGAASGAVTVSREVRVGAAPWRMEPLRPLAQFPIRSAQQDPTVKFTSVPSSGRVDVAVETEAFKLEAATYARFID